MLQKVCINIQASAKATKRRHEFPQNLSKVFFKIKIFLQMICPCVFSPCGAISLSSAPSFTKCKLSL